MTPLQSVVGIGHSIVAGIMLPFNEHQPFEIVALESIVQCSLFDVEPDVNRLGACASRRKLALRSTPFWGREKLSFQLAGALA